MLSLSKATQEFIEQHRTDDIRTLALQSSGNRHIDMPFALQQIEGWQIACQKLPLWSRTKGIIYPPHLSMEQCSSELTARYKANILMEGHTFADLTGGLGVDFSYLARKFKQAWYVERNEELCHIAEHNFNVLGLEQAVIKNEEAEQFLKSTPPLDVIFLDPARRDTHGSKTVAISDCTPNVKALHPLLLQKVQNIMLKLSPMLDISKALNELPDVSDVHIIAVHNECKELLLILNDRKSEHFPVKFHAVNLTPNKTDVNQAFTFTQEEERRSECLFTTVPETYLYEPYTSLLKAGAFRLPCERFQLKKLHPNSHLYTSDILRKDFPGRIFHIEQTIGFSKKELKDFASRVNQANLSVRNFPDSVATLRKRLKLKEGGNIYLFATTLNNGKKVLLKCVKV